MRVFSLIPLLIWALLVERVDAQTSSENHFNQGRSDLEAELAPFYHGVASGDPMPDAVIIWTRITLPDDEAVEVQWRMATDTLFTNIVASGMATADASTDWTVQVDVTGLTANSWFYYDFIYDTTHSLMGRTRTAPVGGVEHLRFGVVSCSNYEHGLYNAYRSLAERNDIDAVLHLGDYIYEYEVGGYSINLEGRTHEPEHETVTLDDYRTRYSHYRLDADLREIHRQYPFIVIWDDHESANDSWVGGAENHTEGVQGAWIDRKNASVRANEEWLPMRKPDPQDPLKIFRKFEYGSLADLLMLDTRLYARDEPGAGPSQNRNLLGYEQRHWLYQNMLESEAKWKILGQQVMMAPLQILGISVNNDQWDGYPGERDSLYQHILGNQIDNTVVLTGDIHTSWGNDLRVSGGVFGSPTPVAVEFVTTSITSPGFPFSVSQAIIQSNNPHVRYSDLTRHGFLILDLTEAAAQSDWYYISTKVEPEFTTSYGAGWKTYDGDNFLSQATAPTVGAGYPALAPLFVSEVVGIQESVADGVIIGAYPNPFYDNLTVQFNAFRSEQVTAGLVDLTGRMVLERNLGTVSMGLHYLDINAPSLAPGMYILTLSIGNEKMTRNVIKK